MVEGYPMDMSAVDKERLGKAVAEARRLSEEVEAGWVADPGEPAGPWLKTGLGLIMG
jgi:hypothetical protein